LRCPSLYSSATRASRARRGRSSFAPSPSRRAMSPGRWTLSSMPFTLPWAGSGVKRVTDFFMSGISLLPQNIGERMLSWQWELTFFDRRSAGFRHSAIGFVFSKYKSSRAQRPDRWQHRSSPFAPKHATMWFECRAKAVGESPLFCWVRALAAF
jgi:hypothetical protein